VTIVGPFVLLHVQIRRRDFGRNLLIALKARREPVPEASSYNEYAPHLESIPIRSTSSFPYHSRGLVSLDHSSRIEGSACRSLDSIPFGILLRWSATTVYLCACGFVRTCQYTWVILTCSRYLGTVVLTLRNTNKHFWRRCWGHEPCGDASKCQHKANFSIGDLVELNQVESFEWHWTAANGHSG
jgi:hypothetical protein